MIIQETLEHDLIKTYSDKNVYIYGGEPEGYYAEAIDPASAGRTYKETDIPIEDEGEEQDPDEATVADYEAALKKLGVE